MNLDNINFNSNQNVNVNCLTASLQNSDLQQKLSSQLASNAAATAAALNIASGSDTENFTRNWIDMSTKVVQAMSQDCGQTLQNTQGLTCKDSANVNIHNVSYEAAQSALINCAMNAIQDNKQAQDIATAVDQSGTATTSSAADEIGRGISNIVNSVGDLIGSAGLAWALVIGVIGIIAVLILRSLLGVFGGGGGGNSFDQNTLQPPDLTLSNNSFVPVPNFPSTASGNGFTGIQ